MRPKQHKHRHPVWGFLLGLCALATAAGFVAVGLFLLWASTLPLPTVEAIEAQRAGQSTKIYDRTGEVLLYDMHQDVRRTVVPLGEITPYLQHATIAIEDERFYKHFGVEPLSIVRAVLHNLQAGNLFGGQGGSTLTQQIIKNTLLTQEKTVTRKLKEWILAVKLERVMTKDQILEMYLNESPYGGTKYGVEEASQGFFGKSAKDLTIAESAYIAALPQAPTYYSPYGNNREALEARKNTVLLRMKEQGYVTEDEYNQAIQEQVTFRPQTGASIKAPHFVFYVIEQLSQKYGDADLAAANLKVTTTLDWDLQREAEAIVYEKALENEKTYNASNASLMAVDPKTGGIMVMVGSRDYFDEEVDGNFNIGLAKRQPGSSFKPFAYAAAIQKGYTSETVVYDVPTQFSTACDVWDFETKDACYSPGNYDHVYRGPMTFREALAQSVNIPAVKVVYLAGTKNTINLARAMGVESLDPNRDYGLTLVLGGGEVSLLEMTSAYGVFAREGYRYPYYAIQEVRDANDNLLETHESQGTSVLDRDTALTISDMLKDNVARTPAFGANSYLYFPDRDVAVKTGTTNDYRDAWIIGYTPDIAVGAWAGNNDNTAMEKKVAGFIVAPMWNAFFSKYFEQHPDNHPFDEPPAIPEDLKPVLRGVRSLGTIEHGSSTSAFIPHSILYYVNKDDPRGLSPAHPDTDPQFAYWEYGVRAWVTGTSSPHSDDTEATGERADVRIQSPADGERFRASEQVKVRISVIGDVTVDHVEYLVDGTRVGTLSNAKDAFTFVPEDAGVAKGDHTLYVIVYQTNGVHAGASTEFTVR